MIQSLAYLGFTSPNAEQWKTFGPEVLGTELAQAGSTRSASSFSEDASDDTVLLRIDEAAWRLAIHPGKSDDLAYIGWEVGDAEGLATVSARVVEAGYALHDGDDELATARNVERISWFEGPFGFRHELTFGQRSAATPFKPGRPMQGGFVTGDGGMGHVVIMVPDLDRANEFFLGTLGFGHSDDVDMGIQVRFLHCNQRHHTLAFSIVPGMVGVHHLMLEVAQPDDVGRAYDIVNERELPLAMTLGRHTNDEMFSFYVRTPSGFEVEYGSGGRLIDPSGIGEPAQYDSVSNWGHRPQAKPLIPAILRPVEA